MLATLREDTDQYQDLYTQNLTAIQMLAENNILLASSRHEAYGCIFGRDTALSCLFLLAAYEVGKRDEILLEICTDSMKNLMLMQGSQICIHSGEEPGKVIHEYRATGHERHTSMPRPWYLYPDGILRNFDSLDSTLLSLLTIHKLIQVSSDRRVGELFEVSVIHGLKWVLEYADSNKDGFVDYQFHPDRVTGGLAVQSWTDTYRIFADDQNSMPQYPIAPVEAQAIAWYVCMLWGQDLAEKNPILSQQLLTYAQGIKDKFLPTYLVRDEYGTHLAQALDGKHQLITTLTGNVGFTLLFSQVGDHQLYSQEITDELVSRLFMPDLFHPRGGIRTMSSLAKHFDPSVHSYHNGSFWPMLNAVIYLGLVHHGYMDQAQELYKASILFYAAFNSPIELYIINSQDEYQEFISHTGKKGCRYQAWTAAGLLAMIACNQKLKSI